MHVWRDVVMLWWCRLVCGTPSGVTAAFSNRTGSQVDFFFRKPLCCGIKLIKSFLPPQPASSLYRSQHLSPESSGVYGGAEFVPLVMTSELCKVSALVTYSSGDIRRRACEYRLGADVRTALLGSGSGATSPV